MDAKLKGLDKSASYQSVGNWLFYISRKGVLLMKTDPLFNLKQKNIFTREKKITFALIITGLLSIILVLITVYGQFTGTFLVKLTYAAEKKGIMLSESGDFTDSTEKLTLKPIQDVEDIVESNLLRIDEILAAPGGHYDDPDGNNYYVAYNFFLKNVGDEVVDIRYDFRVLAQQKRLDKATTVIFYEHGSTGEAPIKKYFMQEEDENYLGGSRIPNFNVNEVMKFTLIVYIDGNRSNETMLGGAVKIDLVFTIETAGRE